MAAVPADELHDDADGFSDELSPLNGILRPDQTDGLVEDYRAFVVRTGARDRDLFLQYVHQQGLIDGEQLARCLKLRVSIEVGDVDEVVARARGELDHLRTYAQMSPQGNYALLGRLGEGSTALVFAAKDHDLKRKVAFKALAGRYAEDEVVRQRFLAEVQITAQLDHPGIVPVYGLDVASDGRMGYAAKLVDGETLHEILLALKDGKSTRMSRMERRLDVFLKICDAVSYAHSKGVLHRDLKPANIMVGAFGETYVMDWGLARLIGSLVDDAAAALSASGSDLTQAGFAVGTPAYMSPEQALGKNKRLDARSDLYTLGLLLQELVTFSPAVQEPTSEKRLLAASRAQRVPMVLHHGKAPPPALVSIVDQATRRERDARYDSVAAMAEDVRCYLDGEAVGAHREGLIRVALRLAISARYAVLFLGMAMVTMAAVLSLGSVGIVWFAESQHQAEQARLTDAVSGLGERAHVIDKEVLRWERLLEAVAVGAKQSLHEPPYDAAIYLASAFDQPETAPKDLALDPLYGRAVSRSHMSFALAPGVSPESVEDVTHRLVRMERMLPGLLAHGLAGVSERFDSEAVASPVGWVYVGTPSGVHAAYPGHGGYTESFDPRQRPWYTLSVRELEHRVQWGNPYIDASGLGRILPCSTSVLDDDGTLLAVVGMDIPFDYLIEALLEPDDRLIKEAFLLDQQGRIVVRSRGAQEEAGGSLALEPFNNADVVRAAVEGRFANVGEADDRFWVFPLDALGWSYVVEADPQGLIGGG